jgi:DNA-binding YbaB/EbfC family protein
MLARNSEAQIGMFQHRTSGMSGKTLIPFSPSAELFSCQLAGAPLFCFSLWQPGKYRAMGMSDMMKNLGNLKQQMGQLKETIEKITAEAEAGGGMVKAVANGEGRLISLKLDPELLNEKDRELAEELIVTAINKAADKARKQAEKEMKSLMGLSGMDKLFR